MILTLIFSYLLASGSAPTWDNTFMPEDFCDLSAKDKVILRWVNDSVEWGLNDNFVRNTAWPCKPVPWRINKWLWSPYKYYFTINEQYIILKE